MDNGRLFLIPSGISELPAGPEIPPRTIDAIKNIRVFLVEDVRTARRYLSSLKIFESIEPLQFSLLNKDTSPADLNELMKPVTEGHDVGVISEAGCPGVADPGAVAVAYAHRHGIKVVPLVGPSSILLAVMASGLNGQQFVFNGYLPVESAAAVTAIGELERESRQKKRTQVFIETPYRNNAIFKNLITSLQPGTMLCIAMDLTSPAEEIRTMSVREWKSQKVDFPKKPAIYLFLA